MEPSHFPRRPEKGERIDERRQRCRRFALTGRDTGGISRGHAGPLVREGLVVAVFEGAEGVPGVFSARLQRLTSRTRTASKSGLRLTSSMRRSKASRFSTLLPEALSL